MKSSTMARILFTITLSITGILAPLSSSIAHAEQMTGYLWSLTFDFTDSYNGTLSIQVGTWQNGDLIDVTAKSESIVPCQPVGTVVLGKGYAGFHGGYLQCTLDIAGALLKNHQLQANPVDTYGSLLISTNAQLLAGNAPVLDHPNARFGMTTFGPMQIAVNTQLTGSNWVSSNFSSVPWSAFQSYSSWYQCNVNGPCRMTQSAAGYNMLLNNQGTAVQFGTQTTQFTIGRGLNGRIDQLFVDPGNHLPPT